jgi:hypothetical protein
LRRMKRALATVVIALAQAFAVPAPFGNLGFVAAAFAETVAQRKAKEEAAAKKAQAAAIAAHDKALREFKAILARRRAEIDARKPLPDLPGQAIYLARMKVMSRYKDLTDLIPARIGRPNKYGVPPDHFDADIEPLIEEYADLFRIMQAPPAFAQSSDTPFEDVVALGTVIARAMDLDAATADVAGRLSLALYFAETGGNQNIGNARSNKYKGSLQTGVAEDRSGRKKWMRLRERVAALDPELAARDEREEARAAGIDQRFNHWTAVRNGLMNAAADLFPHIPAIVAMLPDEMDQMKFFELIQIVPTPTRAALASGNIATYEIRDARVMGYLRNNSMFTFGKANRAKKKATYREILDAMWLFNSKFERALAKFNEIKAQRSAAP